MSGASLNSNDKKGSFLSSGSDQHKMANDFCFYLSDVFVSFQLKTCVVISSKVTESTEIEKRVNFKQKFFPNQNQDNCFMI